MLGVTGVRLVAEIIYDEGTVAVMASPVYNKDIRHGDLFQDEEVLSVLRHAARKIYRAFRKQGGKGLYITVRDITPGSEP